MCFTACGFCENIVQVNNPENLTVVNLIGEGLFSDSNRILFM